MADTPNALSAKVHAQEAGTAAAGTSSAPRMKVVPLAGTQGQPSAGNRNGLELTALALKSRLRPWRHDARYGVKDLARGIDRHPDTILNWINGRAAPDVNALWDMAAFFAREDELQIGAFLKDVFGAAYGGDVLLVSRKRLAQASRGLLEALTQ